MAVVFVAYLVLFAWRLCIVALLCLMCLVVLGGGNFAPLLADKSALRIYQFVRVHLARPSEAGQILLKHASLSL